MNSLESIIRILQETSTSKSQSGNMCHESCTAGQLSFVLGFYLEKHLFSASYSFSFQFLSLNI